MPRVKITGKKEMLAAMREHGRGLNRAFAKGCADASDYLLDAIEYLVPMDTGALRESGGWLQYKENGSTVTVIGYGFEVSGFFDEYGREKDPSLYAVYQHEIPYNHDDEETWLYLEIGLDQEEGAMMNIITTEMMRV
jgi:hypothetical protein